MIFTVFLLGAQHLVEVVKTSWQVRLLCPWARHLTGRPHLYVEDRWRGKQSTRRGVPVLQKTCKLSMSLRINKINNANPKRSHHAENAWLRNQGNQDFAISHVSPRLSSTMCLSIAFCDSLSGRL